MAAIKPLPSQTTKVNQQAHDNHQTIPPLTTKVNQQAHNTRQTTSFNANYSQSTSSSQPSNHFHQRTAKNQSAQCKHQITLSTDNQSQQHPSFNHFHQCIAKIN
jgi:hypothetical protein